MRFIAIALFSLATIQFAWSATGIAPSEIIVKFRDGPSVATRKAALTRTAVLGTMRDIGHNTHVLAPSGFSQKRRSGGDLAAAMAAQLAVLRADPSVEYAEPNYLGEFADLPTPLSTPNDPSYASAWWLDSVRARHAWAVSTGQNVIVAVVDSGVDRTHPDLQGNLLAGYSFGDNNASPQDVLGHGTKVAGIIAGLRNNLLGASGLAPQAKLLPVKINQGGAGTFDTATVAQSVDYAVSQGAKVINMSLNVDQDTRTLEAAIRRAQAAGVIVVAASGNVGGATTGVEFPATVSDVIAVTATNQDGSLGSYARTGPEVTIAAPGTALFTTLLGGGNGSSGNGTSFATPVVSAAIANLLAIDSRLTPARIKALLKASSTPVQGSSQTYGIIDAGGSAQGLLANLTPSVAASSISVAYLVPITGGAVNIYVSVATPVGEFALQSNGTWQPVASNLSRPFASGDIGAASASGNLFGAGGIFPAISSAGLPSGRYVWRIALADALSNRPIGPVVESAITLP